MLFESKHAGTSTSCGICLSVHVCDMFGSGCVQVVEGHHLTVDGSMLYCAQVTVYIANSYVH